MGIILITGGAASGKSAHAERILCQLEPKNRLYLATMQPFGEDAAFRIARHHTLRAGKGFETVERYVDLAALSLPHAYDGILLEDLGNLLANELYAPDGAHENAVSAILAGITALQKQCHTLVIVSNEIFDDGIAYDTQMQPYLQGLASLHLEIAAQAQQAAQSVCGILVTYKGSKL